MDWKPYVLWIAGLTVAGASIPLTVFLGKKIWSHFRKSVATVKLSVPQHLTPHKTNFGLLHVRDGKDETDNSGPLIQTTIPFHTSDRSNELEARVRYNPSFGFQFKCFLEYGEHSFRKVRFALEAAGYQQVSQGEGKPNRAWFILPEYAVCESADGHVNNYLYPQ